MTVRQARAKVTDQCLDKVYEALVGQQVTRFMEDRLNNAITAYRAKNGCDTTKPKPGEQNWIARKSI